MNVALIVPAYKPTKDMLPMLERFSREMDFTAVVVDDGSGDEYAPLRSRQRCATYSTICRTAIWP